MVFMDCRMPEMDGWEATRRLRENGNMIPVVALTANATTDDQIECMQAGMTDFLAKPLDRKQLYRVLEVYASRLRKVSQG